MEAVSRPVHCEIVGVIQVCCVTGGESRGCFGTVDVAAHSRRCVIEAVSRLVRCAIVGVTQVHCVIEGESLKHFESGDGN